MPPEDQDPAPARSSKRVPIDAEVLLEFENFGGFIREVSANISNGGMFIKTRYLKPVGTVVHFQFRLADHMELIRGTGTVVWTRWRDQGPGQPAGMGIQFLDVDEPSQLLIAAIVEQHLQHGGAAFDLGAGEREAAEEEPAAAPAPATELAGWGAATHPEAADDLLPEINFGVLPGLEPEPATSAAAVGFATSEVEAVREPSPATAEEPAEAAPVRAESPPARRSTAPWPTLWSEPEPAPGPDVLTPPEPAPAPAAPAPSVLSRPEPPHWTPPAIPDRKPISIPGAAAERSGSSRAALVVVLVLVALGGAGYYYRGPLLALIGQGTSAAPRRPPATTPSTAPSPVPSASAPEPAATPAVTPISTTVVPATSPPPVKAAPGTLREQVAPAGPAAAAGSPAAPPAATELAVPAPRTAASAAPSAPPAAAASAPAGSGFAGLNRVRWQPTADGLTVFLECDGPVEARRVDRSRIEGAEPREVIRLLGVRRPFDQTRIAVGVGPLKQIRVGYHAGTPAELHIVFDLAGPSARVVGVEPQGSVLRVQLTGR